MGAVCWWCCCCCCWRCRRVRYCCHTCHGHAGHGLFWVSMGAPPGTVSHCISLYLKSSTCNGLGMWGTKTWFHFCSVDSCTFQSCLSCLCCCFSHTYIPCLFRHRDGGCDCWLLSSQDCLRFHWQTPDFSLRFASIGSTGVICCQSGFRTEPTMAYSAATKALWPSSEKTVQLVPGHCILLPAPGFVTTCAFNWNAEIYATFSFFSCWCFEVADTWMFADICWLPGPATYSIYKLKRTSSCDTAVHGWQLEKAGSEIIIAHTAGTILAIMYRHLECA